MTSHAQIRAARLSPAATLVAVTALLVGCSETRTSAPTIGPTSLGTIPSAVASSGQSARATSSATTAPLLRGAPGAACFEGGTGTDCVAPGTYALDGSIASATITVDVPRGWFEWDVGGGTEGLLVDGGSDAPGGSGWGVLFSPIGSIFRDPCDRAAGSVQSADTVDEIVAAMTAWPRFAAGKPKPVTVGGRPGKVVEVSSTQRAATCPSSALWTTPSGTAVDAYPMVNTSETRPTQYLIVDIGGKPLIIRATDYGQPSPYEESQGVKADPKRHADDQVALRAILESIKVTAAGT